MTDARDHRRPGMTTIRFPDKRAEMDDQKHPVGTNGRDQGSMDEDEQPTSEARTLSAAARDPGFWRDRLRLPATTGIQAGRGQSGRAASG
jgi:hypothetical protein